MKKYLKYISFFCLLLCILLAGCADNDSNNSEAVPDEEDTRTYIQVPQDPDEVSDVTEPSSEADSTDTSEDTSDETAGNIINDTPSDTTDETYDTTEESDAGITDDAGATLPGDGAFADMTDAPTVMEATGGDIDLRGILSPMTPVEGTLISSQSDRLFLITKYTCRMKPSGAVEVELEVGLQFYNLICGAKKDMGYITVDGETVEFSTAEINREGKGTYYQPFTSYTYECSPEKSSCDIDVGWDFRGSYAGKKIDMITNSCTLTWDSPN